jgi:hypothetical protein
MLIESLQSKIQAWIHWNICVVNSYKWFDPTGDCDECMLSSIEQNLGVEIWDLGLGSHCAQDPERTHMAGLKWARTKKSKSKSNEYVTRKLTAYA